MRETEAERRRKAFKQFMHRRGWSVTRWARLANMSNWNHIYAYVNGKSKSLNQETIDRLSTAAGVSPEEIFGQAPEETKETVGRVDINLLSRILANMFEQLEKGEMSISPKDAAEACAYTYGVLSSNNTQLQEVLARQLLSSELADQIKLPGT